MNRIAILFFVLLEVFFQLYYVHYNSEIASVVYLIAGVVIGALYIIHNKKSSQISPTSITPMWSYLMMITFLMMLSSYAKDLFAEIPIDYRIADMLPIIEIMGQRFIQGQDPYLIIPQIWGGMQPIYLPALWLTYVPAILLEFDLRWMSIAALSLSIVLIYFKYFKVIHFVQLATYAPILLIILSLTTVDSSLIIMTQEPVVILYYVAMGWALLNSHPKLFGIFAVLSVLSRYALAPWLLMFGLILIWDKRAYALLSILSGTISFVLLMYITNAYPYIDIFAGLSDSYLLDIQHNQGKYEIMINTGLGIAKFFNYEDLHVLHIIMKWTTFGCPLGFGLYYIFNKKRIELSMFGIGSLKVCMVLFYNLIIIPYSYLFYTSTFLSLLILVESFSHDAYSSEESPQL